jgi:hypothetical protein
MLSVPSEMPFGFLTETTFGFTGIPIHHAGAETGFETASQVTVSRPDCSAYPNSGNH